MFSNRDVDNLRRDLCDIGRRVYDHGWVSSHDGNFSIRLGADDFLVTPTRVSKGGMAPEQMVRVNLVGEVLEGEKEPSSEWKMHKASYERRPDIGAIVHTHAPYATAFAVAGLALDRCVLPEMIQIMGAIPLAEYGLPGTEDIYAGMIPLIEKSDAFLLQNHGVVTFGADHWEAYYRHEAIEHSAKIQLLANQLGGAKTLTREQAEAIRRSREKAGLTNPWLNCRCDDEG